MKFPYKQYRNSISRPIIPIQLHYGKREFRYEALIDSGADVSLFDWEVGEDLGIDIRSGVPCEVLGVGGAISTYYLHKTTLVIGGVFYKAEVGFMGSANSQLVSYGILGQKGLFDKFLVGFDFLKEELTLRLRK